MPKMGFAFNLTCVWNFVRPIYLGMGLVAARATMDLLHGRRVAPARLCCLPLGVCKHGASHTRGLAASGCGGALALRISRLEGTGVLLH